MTLVGSARGHRRAGGKEGCLILAAVPSFGYSALGQRLNSMASLRHLAVGLGSGAAVYF